MAKTIHVVPSGREWAVKSSKGAGSQVYLTQREAVASAKVLVKTEDAGQVVVYGRNGKVMELDTYGMPAIQDPPGKKSSKISRAVEKVTLDRLGVDSLPPRG